MRNNYKKKKGEEAVILDPLQSRFKQHVEPELQWCQKGMVCTSQSLELLYSDSVSHRKPMAPRQKWQMHS